MQGIFLNRKIAKYQYFNVHKVRNLRAEHFVSYSNFSNCKHSSVYKVFWHSDAGCRLQQIDYI